MGVFAENSRYIVDSRYIVNKGVVILRTVVMLSVWGENGDLKNSRYIVKVVIS